MHLVAFTNLFPSKDQPRHGVFVRERLMQLTKRQGVRTSVIALRPGRAVSGSGIADDTELLRVDYQKVPTIPKVSNWVDPLMWARAAEGAVRRVTANSDGNTLLDAHFLYPDGVAATILGRKLGLPVVLTARGSDVNVKCKNVVMRRWIRWAAAHSHALITVSGALLDELRHFDIHCPIMQAIPNGVDLERFRPLDRKRCRAEFDVDGHVLLTVGHLVKAKGHHLAIRALNRLPDTTLLIAGDGPKEHWLKALAENMGVGDRVRFLGAIDHAKISSLYTAADALVLASAREGMPNVVLESLACGTPVIASNVGGIPEVLNSSSAGCVLDVCSEGAIAAAAVALRSSPIRRDATRAFATNFGWQPRVDQQIALYERVLQSKGH